MDAFSLTVSSFHSASTIAQTHNLSTHTQDKLTVSPCLHTHVCTRTHTPKIIKLHLWSTHKYQGQMCQIWYICLIPTVTTVVIRGMLRFLWNLEDSSKSSSLHHVSPGRQANPGSTEFSRRAWLTLGSRPTLILILTCQNGTWGKNHPVNCPQISSAFLTCLRSCLSPQDAQRILFLLIQIGHNGRADGAGELSSNRT